MLHSLTNGWELCCHKHWRRNLNNAYLIGNPVKACFFLKGIQQSGLITDQMEKRNSVLGQTF